MSRLFTYAVLLGVVACGAMASELAAADSTVKVVATGHSSEPLPATADCWLADEEGVGDWTSGAISVGGLPYEGATGEELTYDPAIELAQLQFSPFSAPTRQPTRVAASTSRPALRAAATSGLASVPYMIGDTGAGTCIAFSGLVQAELSHPTLACSRLNISEANTPLPTDRVYWSYRHFEDVTDVSAYQFSETLDVDQHTIAWENTFWDRTGSLEIRVPIEQRLRSDVFSIITPTFGVVDPLVAPGDGRQAELGNISLIFKMLLVERDFWAVSAGLGVTLPTARDVNYQLAVDGEIVFPDNPGLTADEAVAFQSVFANETVYLSPFLSWGYAAPSRWFHQGFLQVEVAANPSHVTVDGDGATLFLDNGVPIGFYDYFTPVPVRTELHSQTLMRLNLGWGYILAENRDPDRYRQAAGIFELHYTTTLQDSNLSDVPLTTQTSVGTVPLQAITIGNQENRVDILNAATGISLQLGRWTLTNGLIVPLRDCPECGFDYEYNSQVQRRF